MGFDATVPSLRPEQLGLLLLPKPDGFPLDHCYVQMGLGKPVPIAGTGGGEQPRRAVEIVHVNSEGVRVRLFRDALTAQSTVRQRAASGYDRSRITRADFGKSIKHCRAVVPGVADHDGVTTGGTRRGTVTIPSGIHAMRRVRCGWCTARILT